MDVEVMEYENKNKDDEIEVIIKIWRENLLNLHFTDRELKQHAETLVNDISQFSFDFASNVTKYENHANKFVNVVKSKMNDAIKHVDLYWIYEQLVPSPSFENEKHSYNLIIETSTKSADVFGKRESDAGFLENILEQEFLAARYILRNLHSLDGLVFNRVLNEAKYKNVRQFIDAGLKHALFEFENDFSNLTSFFEEMNDTLILHKCIEENQVFFIDFLITKIIQNLSPKRLKKFLTQKDANNNNVFHLTCEKRIKFLVEEIWNLTLKAFDADSSELEKFLLNQNIDEKNAFVHAFQMPLTYNKSDYANEIKNRNGLFNYYRNPGPLELEMYNFESCLNLIYDIARKNISDKNKKKLIVGKNLKTIKTRQHYNYSKEFSDFRYDFLQIRFYCITRISSIKSDNLDSVARVYQFLSHYVDQYIYINCNNEVDLINLYERLSFDGFLKDFFKSFVHSNFCNALRKIKTFKNYERFIDITRKTLTQKEYHQVIRQGGFEGNNALQIALLFGDQEMFKLIWSSFKLDRKAVIDWILNKNNEGMNSFHMAINFHKIEILQPMLEFFSLHLNETEIIDIFDKSTKANYKFLDMVVLFYNESIFNLLVDFIHNHLSMENKKKIISSNIISFAVSKWQESALVKTLNFIENLFDENEIKEIIFAKNWENQTAFHVASKNSKLSQLQTLCKFAHYYLSTEDFVKIISTKDSNDYSIVNDLATHDEIYNNLPNLSNFATNYSVYVWIALLNDELDIPKEAIKIGAHENGEVIYLARGYKEKKVELFGITKSTDIKELEYQYIDILAGFGVNWINKDADNISPLKIENMEETYHIGKLENSVKLISAHSEEKFNELLCINNQILHETNLNNFIFKRSF